MILTCSAMRTISFMASACSIRRMPCRQRFFGTLLGGQRGSLVQVLGAQCGVSEHRDLVGLHFECATADEEMLLGAIPPSAHALRPP